MPKRDEDEAAAETGGFSRGPGRPSKERTEAKRRIAEARSEAADQAVAKAKAVGAVGTKTKGGKSLSSAARALRDSAIAASVEAGRSVGETARIFDVSARTVSVVVERGHQISLLDRRPIAFIEDRLRRGERRAADLMAIAAEHADIAPHAAIAALRAASREDQVLVAMLAEVGYLPSQLRTFRTEREVGHLAAELMDRLAAFERGELPASDVADYARDVFTGVRPLFDTDDQED